jgi:hypothetical protein
MRLKKWGLGIGDWGLGIGPNPQSPIPNHQIGFQELDDMLTLKEIKSMTLENRNFKGIDKFINSNTKFNKKMTDERKKKVLYGTEAKIFFEEKMLKNNKKLNYPDENPFMKNEWFMGPIYSYDKNYKKLI